MTPRCSTVLSHTHFCYGATAMYGVLYVPAVQYRLSLPSFTAAPSVPSCGYHLQCYGDRPQCALTGLQRSSATVRSHGAARPGDAIVLRGSAAVVRNRVPVAWPGHAALPALHLMTVPHVPPSDATMLACRESPYVKCTPRCLFAGSSRCGNLHYWATAPVRDSVPRCVVYSLKCARAVMRDHATTRYYGHRPLLRTLAAP
jgi:hypothetical protein